MHIEYVECDKVEAVPYDMLLSGYDSKAVSQLRLWKARDVMNFDMDSFAQGDYAKATQENTSAELISKVLYPDDRHFAGKTLRLKQQYLLVSASVQNIVKNHLSEYKTLSSLADKAAIHINDTHPALAIPELMRLLLDEHHFSWDGAWDIVTKTMAYTNHTVLQEALETWPEEFIQRKLPRIYSIIKEINERFCKTLWDRFPGDWARADRASIISHGVIKMAHLAIVGSHKVNGVSALHSQILQQSVFKDFYELWPEKFTNVTNGIAHRRWLCEANPALCGLLSECIGEGFWKKPEELQKFLAFREDGAF